MTVTKESDAQDFFSFILKQNNTIQTLLSDFLDYHGGLDWGQMGLVYETITKLLLPRLPAVQSMHRNDIIDANSTLSKWLFEQFLPERSNDYFIEADAHPLITTRVFGPTVNTYKSDILPARLSHRLHLEKRPGLDIYEARGRSLFLAPYGYQYFDSIEGCYWPIASSRAFSKSILAYPEHAAERPIVIVQDQYDTRNFAHFLYDSVPRILYFIQTFPGFAKTALYILGGVKTEFHSIILSAISKIHGLDEWNFLFPKDRMILKISSSVFFFSDQKTAIMHPLHMCGPETISRIKNLINTINIPKDTPERIYISRRDAGMRKLRNEDALIHSLKKNSFMDVILNGLKALDQIALLANAQHIVAPHGMGLTNIIFNNGNARLTELFNPELGSDAYAFVAIALGMDYRFHVGSAVENSKTTDYEVDIDIVTENLPERREGQLNPLHRYHNANMADPPGTLGLLEILEPAREVPRRMPAFLADLSGRGLTLNLPSEQHVHGSFLVRRENVLLFGPSNLVDEDGHWSCEARAHKRQFLSYMKFEFFDRMWPGPKPQVDERAADMRLETAHLHASDVETIETPVFLATPLEPPIWGRWIATVTPKIMQYKQHGAGRKFFCYTTLPWQKAFLAQLGLGEDLILAHDPGRTYICRDVMTVEYSETNMSISALERLMFFEIVAAHKIPVPPRRKIFVSRLSRSKANPNYRVLQNEAELATMLVALGFSLVEPETLSFAEQLSIFARAEDVVFLGGSGVYNAAFCAPGTRVITIESSSTYITAHTELFASLGLDYGVIFGEQDLEDPTPDHKRWHVDVARVQAHVVHFFGG